MITDFNCMHGFHNYCNYQGHLANDRLSQSLEGMMYCRVQWA